MNLTIQNKQIRTRDGLYCLNDLHKASGGEGKNRPSIWMENQKTKELIGEIVKAGNPASKTTDTPVVTVKGGRSSGIYACKELVYAYAMWISPAFHLAVIKAYDALITGQLQDAERKVTRQNARLEAPFMTDAIKITRESKGKACQPFHFSNEFDLINRVALGMTAKQYRAHHNLSPGQHIRDTLTALEIACVEHLQRANTTMIEIGFDFEQRKNELSKLYVQRHAKGLLNEIEQLEF